MTGATQMTQTDQGNDALIQQIRTQGYGVLNAALTDSEVNALNEELLRLCRGDLGTFHPAQTDPTADILRKYLCIHFPHKLSALFHEQIRHPRIVDVLSNVIGPDVKCMQSMVFVKSEGKPGQAWHQDEYFIPTRDRSLTAAWIALDDATVDNGCLWVLPGSHAPGVIYPDRQHDDPRFDCSVEAFDFPYRDEDAVPVEVTAGSIVFFNGYLLHRSLPNNGRHGLRRALAYHYMSAQSLLPWRTPREGEHMAKVDDRDIVMVCGRDPYAWKGLEDRRNAFVRPDRDGGCER